MPPLKVISNFKSVLNVNNDELVMISGVHLLAWTTLSGIAMSSGVVGGVWSRGVFGANILFPMGDSHVEWWAR